LSATWQHWITGESEEICGNVVGVSVCTWNCLFDFSRLKGDLEGTYSQL
jgi:hypothetical protein